MCAYRNAIYFSSNVLCIKCSKTAQRIAKVPTNMARCSTRNLHLIMYHTIAQKFTQSQLISAQLKVTIQELLDSMVHSYIILFKCYPLEKETKNLVNVVLYNY